MTHRYTSKRTPIKDILAWQIKKLFSSSVHSAVPVMIHSHHTMPKGEYALWLGHASIYLSIGNSTIIIDPVLGNIPMYRRHSPLPLPQKELYADIVLITHAHYDHFDKPSLKTLLRNNPNLTIVAPNGFWRYLKKMIPRERCFELEWWESVMIHNLFITLVPSHHWSRRTPFDTNKALWGGYVIQNHDYCIYHSGDTAMGEHFKEIGEKFDIDLAFLPIGAYQPENLMKHNHTNPFEALQAASDLATKTMVPIHHGTFRLTDEPLHEPLEWLNRLLNQHQYTFSTQILDIGDIYRFKTISTDKST